MRQVDIKGFEEYQINDSGDNNKSVWSKKRQLWMKATQMQKGYAQIRLSKNGKSYPKYLHRLIAEAFIPNPEGKPEIDHINTVRDDNRVENLRWVTHKENGNNPLTKEKISESTKGKIINEATRAKLSAIFSGKNSPNYGRHHTSEARAKISAARKGKYMGKDHPNSIPIVQLTKDGEFIKQWDCAAEAERELGVLKTSICFCLKGRYNHAGGFKWVYQSDFA